MKRRAILARAADKRLSKIPEPTHSRILAAIQRYAETEQGDVRPLAGMPSYYRLRVGGWRVLFQLEAEIMRVRDIRERGGAYK